MLRRVDDIILLRLQCTQYGRVHTVLLVLHSTSTAYWMLLFMSTGGVLYPEYRLVFHRLPDYE